MLMFDVLKSSYICARVCVGKVAPAPVRSQEEAERKRNLQRALDGLTPGLQDVEMAEGQQHDICNWASTRNNEFVPVRSCGFKPQGPTWHDHARQTSRIAKPCFCDARQRCRNRFGILRVLFPHRSTKGRHGGCAANAPKWQAAFPGFQKVLFTGAAALQGFPLAPEKQFLEMLDELKAIQSMPSE